MQTVDIYIDTSIKGPRRRDGTCLYIIAFRAGNGLTADAGDRIKEAGTTENHLVLLGLETALKRLKKPCILNIYLECTHVAAALQNRWYEEWRNHNWMTAKGAEVADAPKWRAIQYLLNEHDFQVHLKEEHSYREWMQHELAAGKGGRNV